MSTENTVKRALAAGISRRLFLANGLAAAGTMFLGNLDAFAKAPSTASTIDYTALKSSMKGQVVFPEDNNFRKYAFDGLWNRLQPNRTPGVIARCANEQDVVEAVKFAKANNLKVVVRGGGHNWCCPSLRNSGMMIDLTELNKIIEINEEKRTAILQPILSNREVMAAVNAKGLAFPTGHCPQVKVSGYLLGGGMSWNQGTWGPGVASVEAIEVVTPDGEMIKADKNNHTDYFWAARGAGSGFFGVAVRYHVKLYPTPKYITGNWWSCSIDDAPAIADYLEQVAPKTPSNVELSFWLVPAPAEHAEKAKKHNGKMCMVTASVFAENREEALAAIKLVDECPAFKNSWARVIGDETTFDKLFDASGALFPENCRARVEATFSNANFKDLFVTLGKEYESSPAPDNCIMFAIFTGPNVPAPLITDAAFSMSAKLYGGPWTQWKNAADDDVNSKYHDRVLAALKPFVAGYYISESDTIAFPEVIPAAFVPKNYARIKELRAKHDPDGVFFNYRDGIA